MLIFIYNILLFNVHNNKKMLEILINIKMHDFPYISIMNVTTCNT